MPANEPRSAIEGSARAPIPAARDAGPVAPDERIEVTIRVRSGTAGALAAAGIGALLERRAAHEPAPRPPYLTRAELRTAGGADPAEIGLVEAFAREHGLAVLESDRAERRVVVAGAAARLAAAFGVTLRRYELDGQSYRGRTGEITVPARLGSVIVGVFGLDDRPQARPHFRLYQPPPADTDRAGAFRPATQVERSFTPGQVAHLYDFVPDADGSGETIALIELGGGLRPADIQAYFGGLGSPEPTVTIVSVDGGRERADDRRRRRRRGDARYRGRRLGGARGTDRRLFRAQHGPRLP